MYILIIARDFPQPENPLRGIFEFDQARALKGAGHKVVFVALDMRSIRRKRKLGKYWTRSNGIDILNISIPLGNIPAQILISLGRKALGKFFPEVIQRHGKPDLIHAHFSISANVAIYFREKLKIPVVITEHSSKISDGKPSKKIYKLGKVYSQADAVITVSSILSENLNLHWGVKTTVIPNVVDSSAFSFNEKFGQKGSFTFISIGNLIHRKGFDLLIEAFSQCNFEDNIFLDIVGNGPLRKKLQEEISKKGLTNKIKLLGFLDRKGISEVMAKSNCFVLSSRGETFGVVYIEAMLSGLPVIATSCGGPEDFVNPTNGILIPVNSKENLITALKSMYNNRDEYDRKRISENAFKKFSPEFISDQLTNLYSEVLCNHE